jgi:hypothetical protein
MGPMRMLYLFANALKFETPSDLKLLVLWIKTIKMQQSECLIYHLKKKNTNYLMVPNAQAIIADKKVCLKKSN